MRKTRCFLSVLIVIGFVSLAYGDPFTPGNLCLVDASDDMIIEVELDEENEVANVVQIVRWEREDTSRSRPLGITFDPAGNCYVGITSVPLSATEAVEFPSGIGEILRIAPDGTQEFFRLPKEITKCTWMSSFNANECFVMGNDPAVTIPSYATRVRFSGSEIADLTNFRVDDDEMGSGKAMIMPEGIIPEGNILIPNTNEPVINIYSSEGGEPNAQIDTEKGYRSLAYFPDTDYFLAIPGTGSVDQINFQGEVLGTFDFTIDGLGGVWNFTIIPPSVDDERERFIATNHNGPQTTKSMVFIYDVEGLTNLDIYPQTLIIDGLQNFGDSDGLATQLFDHSFVPVPVAVQDWAIY